MSSDDKHRPAIGGTIAPEQRTAVLIPQALDLRLQGYSYREIAQRLSVGLPTAHRYVMNALAESREVATGMAEELRELEIQKLDLLESKLWERLDGSASASEAARVASAVVKVAESRRKLLGLDAPQRIEASGNLYTIAAASPDCPEWDAPQSAAAPQPLRS